MHHCLLFHRKRRLSKQGSRNALAMRMVQSIPYQSRLEAEDPIKVILNELEVRSGVDKMYRLSSSANQQFEYHPEVSRERRLDFVETSGVIMSGNLPPEYARWQWQYQNSKYT
jgi:hypothetical protein